MKCKLLWLLYDPNNYSLQLTVIKLLKILFQKSSLFSESSGKLLITQISKEDYIAQRSLKQKEPMKIPINLFNKISRNWALEIQKFPFLKHSASILY